MSKAIELIIKNLPTNKSSEMASLVKSTKHLNMEYYAAERKKELLPFTTAWMDLGSIMLSEISQEVKDK